MTDTHGQGAPATPPGNVSALVEAIDARARQAGSEGAATLLRGTLTSVSEVLSAIQDRLDHLEEALAERHEPTSVTEQVQAGLNSLNSRLGRLEEAFVRAVEDSGSGTEAVVDQLRQTVVAALREAPARDSSGVDAGLRDDLRATSGALGRIEAALDELSADRDTSAQPPAIPELEALAQRLEGVEGRLADQSDLTRQVIERMEEAQSGEMESLRRSIEALTESLAKAPAADPPGASPAALANQVTEAVRREAELITQRVAALAVGVEASRAMLEQHVEETENSLGRKASEVTRRLASDLGLRARRGQHGGPRRDPRQLGPGS